MKQTEKQRKAKLVSRLLARLEKAKVSPWTLVYEIELRSRVDDLRVAKADPEDGKVWARASQKSWIEDELDAAMDDGARDFARDFYESLLDYLQERGPVRTRKV